MTNRKIIYGIISLYYENRDGALDLLTRKGGKIKDIESFKKSEYSLYCTRIKNGVPRTTGLLENHIEYVVEEISNTTAPKHYATLLGYYGTRQVQQHGNLEWIERL